MGSRALEKIGPYRALVFHILCMYFKYDTHRSREHDRELNCCRKGLVAEHQQNEQDWHRPTLTTTHWAVFNFIFLSSKKTPNKLPTPCLKACQRAQKQNKRGFTARGVVYLPLSLYHPVKLRKLPKAIYKCASKLKSIL